MGVTDGAREALRDLELTPDEDEFDPFAGEELDPPPGEEGDDRAHEGEEGNA